jgi:hypothetical protein
MNNEPVAELVLEQMAVGDASSLRVKWLVDNYPPVGTKLYTHPVKEHFEDEPQAEELHEIMQSNLELTDEEIMDELVKVKHTWVATTSVWFEFEKEELKKAIRAILRKAQER